MNGRMISKSTICFALILSAASVASAQTQPGQAGAPTAAPACSPAQTIDMFAFPKNGQSADQQLKDESERYGMAKQRTGVDAQVPPPQGPSAEEVQAAQQQAAANAQSKQQAAAQASAALKKQTEELQREHQEGIDTFQRAFAACMDSRNYSVK
jgi:hypothetical protein